MQLSRNSSLTLFIIAGLSIFLVLSAAQVLPAQGLIVNEVSQGPSGNKEYIEFVVDGTACNTVDLRGWIIDDNNGDFACGAITGVGIASGHVRFANNSNWAAVPVGAIILIHNDADVNALVPADDVSDSNLDSIFVVPLSSTLLERHSSTGACPLDAADPIPLGCSASCPATGSPAYLPSTYTAGGNNTQISMANGGDAFQSRNPSGTYYHGVSWGPAAITGGPDGLKVSAVSSSGKVYYLTDGNPRTLASWATGNDDGVSGGNETPGTANSASNAAWIQSLLGDCGLLGQHTLSMEAWRTTTGVKIEWSEQGEPPAKTFYVERASGHGAAFANIATFTAQYDHQAYSWTDNAAPSDVAILYRIRSVSEDGSFTYSPIAEVKTLADLSGGIAVFPNPSREKVQFQFTEEGYGRLMLFDLNGKSVYQGPETFFSGFSEVSIPVSNLTPGLYGWSLIMGSRVYSGKLVRE